MVNILRVSLILRTFIQTSEIKAKYEKQVKYLPIMSGYCSVTGLSLALIPYSTFLRRKL